MALAAVISELGLASGTRQSVFFKGIVGFFYGGVAALFVFITAASVSSILSHSPRAQTVGFVSSAVFATAVWLAVVVFTTYLWPPLCLFFSVLAATLMVFLARSELAVSDGASPEQTLERLRQVKRDLKKL